MLREGAGRGLGAGGGFTVGAMLIGLDAAQPAGPP